MSTAAAFHGTCAAHSRARTTVTQRSRTPDDSRNRLLTALIELGEGSRTSYHRYPSSVRPGFRWRAIEIVRCVLWRFARGGLIRDLKPIPASRCVAARAGTTEAA